MTRYISPAQARQDCHLRWHRMLHRFACAAGAVGSADRHCEPDRSEVVVFGPCGGDGVRATPARAPRSMRRRDRQPTRDTEIEAGG
jgi:hypothetical protein